MKRVRKKQPMTLQCQVMLQSLDSLSYPELKKLKYGIQEQMDRIDLKDTSQLFKIFTFKRDEYGMFCMTWVDDDGKAKQLKRTHMKNKKSYVVYNNSIRYGTSVSTVEGVLGQYLCIKGVSKKTRHKAALYFIQNGP